MEEEASGWWLEEEEALGVGGGRSSWADGGLRRKKLPIAC
jgi:hypothetical protein